MHWRGHLGRRHDDAAASRLAGAEDWEGSVSGRIDGVRSKGVK